MRCPLGRDCGLEDGEHALRREDTCRLKEHANGAQLPFSLLSLFFPPFPESSSTSLLNRDPVLGQ